MHNLAALQPSEKDKNNEITALRAVFNDVVRLEGIIILFLDLINCYDKQRLYLNRKIKFDMMGYELYTEPEKKISIQGLFGCDSVLHSLYYFFQKANLQLEKNLEIDSKDHQKIKFDGKNGLTKMSDNIKSNLNENEIDVIDRLFASVVDFKIFLQDYLDTLLQMQNTQIVSNSRRNLFDSLREKALEGERMDFPLDILQDCIRPVGLLPAFQKSIIFFQDSIKN